MGDGVGVGNRAITVAVGAATGAVESDGAAAVGDGDTGFGGGGLIGRGEEGTKAALGFGDWGNEEDAI